MGWPLLGGRWGGGGERPLRHSNSNKLRDAFDIGQKGLCLTLLGN